jgi:hypothetical protein
VNGVENGLHTHTTTTLEFHRFLSQRNEIKTPVVASSQLNSAESLTAPNVGCYQRSIEAITILVLLRRFIPETKARRASNGWAPEIL